MSQKVLIWSGFGAFILLFLVPLSLGASIVTPQNVVSEVNRVRSGYNLAPLKEVSNLNMAAESKAEEIALLGELIHTPVVKGEPWALLAEANYVYKKAGEILAANLNTAETLVSAWMESSSHRATLLSPEYTEIGIGIGKGLFKGRESNFVVGYLALPREPEAEIVETKEDPRVLLLQKLILLLNDLIAQYKNKLAQNAR